ncbi:succinylglutamate desuccinylase/aspartoacylase family protein [Burkholderia multivorans]|uniref:succinylglutamate desuccinylase/aspartoacylase family protein n=1 Tax=Burkholderia multivorans TaxID=87883 RepID=UPI001C276CF8|nr:succinylglutamate desuccinylase/aspartoacylase family protein [Burkholderia multivorans]MBU9597999.1 succinylglutamate desuccinylase/aspartoacylase family protein [Burkholderia multivorans]
MAHVIETVPLLSASPGTQRTLKVHRIGKIGARPKAYFQAALHANETPGLLIGHHLLSLALAADRAGRFNGELVIVPFANPIGLSDNVLGNQIGREALDGGGNYNRGWPDLSRGLEQRVEGKLSADGEANKQAIRDALKATLDALRPLNEVQSLQTELLKLAIDADFVVDSHTELVAIAGMVVAPWCEAMLDPFVAEIDPGLVHVTDTPTLFDGTCSKPWHDLRQKLGATWPIPQGNVSVTIEMRGAADVTDELASRDANAIFRHLARIGVVEGEFDPHAKWSGEKTPHEAISMMRTPVGGVVVYPFPLGTDVQAGDVIAEIVDPNADDPALARTQIRAKRPGRLYAAVSNRLVRPNDIVIKIAANDFARA